MSLPNYRLSFSVRLALGLCLAGGALSTALAQGTDERRLDAIEEVIVTAEKREESLQRTPISLAVLDRRALENLGIATVADLATQVPNFRAIAFPISPTTIRLFIRGIGTNEAQLTRDPGVGVYLNGIYVARSSGLSMEVADLERVEILRGPQGTLYGRNATGGAVSLVTAKPTGEFGLKQEFSVGSLDFWRTRTQLNLPEVGARRTREKQRRRSRLR
jgi:iron complex outermembrane receptor protein